MARTDGHAANGVYELSKHVLRGSSVSRRTDAHGSCPRSARAHNSLSSGRRRLRRVHERHPAGHAHAGRKSRRELDGVSACGGDCHRHRGASNALALRSRRWAARHVVLGRGVGGCWRRRVLGRGHGCRRQVVTRVRHRHRHVMRFVSRRRGWHRCSRRARAHRDGQQQVKRAGREQTTKNARAEGRHRTDLDTR